MQVNKVDYEWKALNLENFKTKPQYSCVMQLLVMLNDLDSIEYLNDLITDKHEDLKEKQVTHHLPINWLDGIRLYILRLNILAMFEGIETIDHITNKVKKLSKQGTTKKAGKKEPLLWEIIIADERLSSLLKELNSHLRVNTEYLDNGVANCIAESGASDQKPVGTPLYETMAFIRDKLSGHSDAGALKDGIDYLLTQGYDEGVIGKRPDKARFRAFFIDNIITQSWKKTIVELLCKGCTDEAKNNEFMNKEYPKLVFKVKEVMGTFAFLLLVKFMSTHKLAVSTEREDSIAQEMLDVVNLR